MQTGKKGDRPGRRRTLPQQSRLGWLAGVLLLVQGSLGLGAEMLPEDGEVDAFIPVAEHQYVILHYIL